MPAQTNPDLKLDEVADKLKKEDPEGERFARALRRTIDMLLDGVNTGRYRWEQLHKTEKTHAGTLVEINLQREFDFDDGDKLDYRICGVDVDCKFSQDNGRWMIPPEAIDSLCLVVWADDQQSRFQAGIIRARSAYLTERGNRDGKRSIKAECRGEIRWIFPRGELQPNILLHLPPEDVEAIFAHKKSGAKRVDELFRRAQNMRISRTVVQTVAMQHDPLKRVRANGGSRSRLQQEGIIILGHYGAHQKIARALALEVPQHGEFVSARVVRWDGKLSTPHVELGGEMWMAASAADPVVPAPTLPKISGKSED